MLGVSKEKEILENCFKFNVMAKDQKKEFARLYPRIVFCKHQAGRVWQLLSGPNKLQLMRIDLTGNPSIAELSSLPFNIYTDDECSKLYKKQIHSLFVDR
jgi:hypothetical protein